MSGDTFNSGTERCQCGDMYCPDCGPGWSSDWCCKDNFCSEPVENPGDLCSEHPEVTA